MIKLRPYQRYAIDMLYAWMSANPGHPVLNLPTGAGKSIIVAELCRDAIHNWPETTILMLVHQKELIEQNAEKLKTLWPSAPLGIYSASVGVKNLDQITFAGIQSIRGKSAQLGHIDICIVDECHLISHKEDGSYRTLLTELLAINPAMRIVGLTATPYRLGHGLITDKPAIFDDILTPVTLEDLWQAGFLAEIDSRSAKEALDVSGVHKRGGEYIESELQEAVDKEDKNKAIVQEIIARAGNRQSWLLFCSGVDHAQHIADELTLCGISARCVTGQTPKIEREEILTGFKSGRIKALTNAQVLTTGFDAPNVDLIAFLRPTLSGSLYVQMAGRGLRIKPQGGNCLVLDFAGLVATHGPITSVFAPKKPGEGDGTPPQKICPNIHCMAFVHAAVQICPICGEPFLVKKKDEDNLWLRKDDIMGKDKVKEFEVISWSWSIQKSKSSGKDMIVCTYMGNYGEKPIKEYFTVWHDGWAGVQSKAKLAEVMQESGIPGEACTAEAFERGVPPSTIKYEQDGKFVKIIKKTWEEIPF